MIPVTNAAGTGTPTAGSVISAGSSITALGTDRISNIWVGTQSSSVYVISDGSSTAKSVSGLTYIGTPSFGGEDLLILPTHG